MIYRLIKTMSYKGLVEEVNEYIAKGWIPQGGVMEDSNGRCLQAMIKNE
jgi:hypothetical protein